jgi:YbbR domain-containing protein
MLQRIIDWTTNDWALKLTALALAFVLWTTVRGESPHQWTAEDIAVRVVNNDADWVVADAPSPSEVRVVFTGPYRELLRAASERPQIIARVDQVTDSSQVLTLHSNLVAMPPGTPNVRVVEVTPSSVRVPFDRVSTRLITVVPQLRGELGSGFEFTGPIEVEPNVVRASGSSRNLARIDSLLLPPIDLRERRGMDTLQLVIDTAGSGLIISPRTIRVIVPVQPVLADTYAVRTGAPRQPRQ